MTECRKLFIKICGITSKKDMVAVVKTGISAIGFIAFPKSPRYINPELVLEICKSVPDGIRKVGVFVDADIKLIEQYIQAGIDTVQLHGNENINFINSLKCSNSMTDSIEIWKVIKPKSKKDVLNTISFPVNRFLIDTFHKKLHGGTGKTADWDLAKYAVKTLPKPVILAGGLNGENILEAIRKVKPFGVDISSGVEKAPGIKDHRLVKSLVDKVTKTNNGTIET